VLFALDGKVRVPARFAVDWMKLDPDGHYASGDEKQVANWYGYGEDVLAVAAGTVANVRDSIGESATSSDDRRPLGHASGNFVTLAIGPGTYAHYEHLKPGSIRVKKGEHVSIGQVIGSLGYTGDSTGPHLHFHVSTGDAPLDGEGLPYALRTFEVAGTYPSIEAFAQRKPWQPLPAGSPAFRRREFPAANVVVEFDDNAGNR
jgi:murein DD-endopeptidase MepM/ murein hydrolase activator NlpD